MHSPKSAQSCCPMAHLTPPVAAQESVPDQLHPSGSRLPPRLAIRGRGTDQPFPLSALGVACSSAICASNSRDIQARVLGFMSERSLAKSRGAASRYAFRATHTALSTSLATPTVTWPSFCLS